MAFLHNLFRKKSIDDTTRSEGLHKNLSVRDLTALGIAAIIGAGIFSTIGSACFEGGPAVILLFIFVAATCVFVAFAYAEFASLVPVSGGAYSYLYVSFGEVVAWIIGWALVMEYAVGNIVVAASWSEYFTGLLKGSEWQIPSWATIDYGSAHKGFNEAEKLLQDGVPFLKLNHIQKEAYEAWQFAPGSDYGLRVILDIPAILMSTLITVLAYVGIKESKTVGAWMVALKLIIVLSIIIVGVFGGFVKPDNWTPFMPTGFGGVMAGVSSVFFAYVGFDALSTTAEECKNPQRDLPRAMLYSIIICTILYILIALVLTGMVNYEELKDVKDPLAYAFREMEWFSNLIAIIAVVAMTSVFLVFQLGQPRIWMAMSRDGLLPKRFSYIHPKFRTPTFATLVTGFLVVGSILFISSHDAEGLFSMGTLLAFILVCAGVLKLQINLNAPRRKFRTPYVNSKWVLPLMAGTCLAFLFIPPDNRENTYNWLKNKREVVSAEEFLKRLDAVEIAQTKAIFAAEDSLGMDSVMGVLPLYLEALKTEASPKIAALPFSDAKRYDSGWWLFLHKIPMWLFVLTCLLMVWLGFRHNLSLIPVLGLISCAYMMAEISIKSWFGFLIWLVLGLLIYFGYGYTNSKMVEK